MPISMLSFIIIERKDLNMRKGKLAAQVAHASMATLTNFLTKNKSIWYFEPDNAMADWLNNSFTKICVSVNSEEELISIYKRAQEAGVNCSIIQDSGRTEFHGVPTYTTVGVGPAAIDEVNKITGHLPLI